MKIMNLFRLSLAAALCSLLSLCSVMVVPPHQAATHGITRDDIR